MHSLVTVMGGTKVMFDWINASVKEGNMKGYTVNLKKWTAERFYFYIKPPCPIVNKGFFVQILSNIHKYNILYIEDHPF